MIRHNEESMDDFTFAFPAGWDGMEVMDFLYESNLIENVDGDAALYDAVQAWDHAYRNRKKIDVDYILEIHGKLLRNIEPDIAGKLRDCDVWIGGKLKPFVSHTLVKEQLKTWIKHTKITEKMVNRSPESKEDLVKKWHIEFEELHVFTDGNGRVGRILYNIHRALLDMPLHIISSETKYDDYYPWFK